MAAAELEVVVLVPVFEGQVVQGRCVGKLQVSKVPVQDLSVPRGEVDVRGGVGLQLLQLVLQLALLLHQLVILLI